MQTETKRMAKNGVPIYSYLNPASGGFYLSLFVKAGSMYEDEREAGITHFFEHISIRNVNKLMNGTLYPLLDRYGIEFNASSFSEMVQFYLSGCSKNFRISAEILSKLFSPIALDKTEIDAERGRVKAEIREVDDRTSLASFTQDIVFKDTSLARPLMGSATTVNRITKTKLEKYRNEIFSKDNIFVYVTGNVSEEDMEYITDLISNCDVSGRACNENVAPVPEKFFKRENEVHLKNADFTKIRFTFDLDMKKLTVPETDLIYDILLGGYNSDFFIELSEKRGLFYDLNGTLERYSNIGTFCFNYELKEQKLYEAVEKTLEILKNMKENILHEEKCMKAGYVDNCPMLYDDNRDLNFTFAYDNHILTEHNKSLEDRRKVYDSITPERIREISRTIFKKSNLTLTLKGNKKTVDTEKLKALVDKYL